MRRIFKKKFRSGRGIANIGWQQNVESSLEIGGLLPFGYISSYKNTADDLVEEVLDTELINSYVFPIVFLYRQYLELLLKNIYFVYIEEDSRVKTKFIKDNGHRLDKIWVHKIKPYFKTNRNLSPDEIKFVGNLIEEFTNYDPNSFSFRYYYNKDFSSTLPDQLSVNLLSLKQQIDKVDNILYSSYS